MISLISEQYESAPVGIRVADGYVNATQMAKAAAAGARRRAPAEFLSAESTRRFIHALAEDLSTSAKVIVPTVKLVEVHRGGIAPGTWMHPDLAIEFARWLSPKFAIWTNRVVRKVLSGGKCPSMDAGADTICPKELERSLGKFDERIKSIEEFLSRSAAGKVPPSSPYTSHAEYKAYCIQQLLQFAPHIIPMMSPRRLVDFEEIYGAMCQVCRLPRIDALCITMEAIKAGLLREVYIEGGKTAYFSTTSAIALYPAKTT